MCKDWGPGGRHLYLSILGTPITVGRGQHFKESSRRDHRQGARPHRIFIRLRALLNRNKNQVKLAAGMKSDLLGSSACSQMALVSVSLNSHP